MSSTRLENAESAGPAGASGRLLRVLKLSGAQTIAELAATAGTTAEAVRQQLARLAGEGLVDYAAEPRGRGRPARVYSLTSAGHAAFADGHAPLAVQLIDSVRSVLGERALGKLVAAREASAKAEYAARLAPARSLGERVRLLAQARSSEGYMAEWSKQGRRFLLVENHCPIRAAADACPGFCQAELQTFRDVLPGVPVERVEHALEGDRRCAYRIG